MDRDVHPTVAETTHDLLQGARHDVAALRADLNHVRGKMAELQEGVTILRETNLEGVDLSGVDLTTTLLPKGYTPPVAPAATRARPTFAGGHARS